MNTTEFIDELRERFPKVDIYHGCKGYVLRISEYRGCMRLPDFDGFKIETYEDILEEKLRRIKELKSEIETKGE